MTRHGSPSPTAHRFHRTLLGLVAGLAVALLFGACGQTTGQSNGDAMPSGHDRGDVTFARAMMARDGQAQMMEGWAQGRAGSASVRAMASRMMRSQGGWDKELKACVTRWSGSSPQGMMDGQMMGNDEMAGRMSPTVLKDLKAASGPAFDRMYLAMMIRHHTSMIAAAAAEVAGGGDPAAVRLARHIRRSQTKELAQLRRLLRR